MATKAIGELGYQRPQGMATRSQDGGFRSAMVLAVAATLFGCGKTKPADGSDADAGTSSGGKGSGGSGTLTGGMGGGAGQAQGGKGGGATGGAGGGGGSAAAQSLIILHTNDLHSHLMGSSPEVDYSPGTLNDDDTTGGFARLMTAIATERTQAAAAGKPVLLLDAGDFMMGTLFHFLATSASAELKLMAQAGYDATTIGNHELDWTPKALAGIIGVAAASSVKPLVPILASNMHFSDTDAGDDELKLLQTGGLIKTKLVKTVGGLKVGIFGLLGADAVQVTPQAKPLTFDAIDVAAKAMVTELRLIDKVDLVIALSHSGIHADGTGEDQVLASKVTGIDVIVSGHTHDSLSKPVTVGKTLIVTAGSYGNFLGKLDISVVPAGAGAQATVTVNGYTLGAIDDKIMGDVATQTTIDGYIAGIDTALAAGGLAYRKVVASTTGDVKTAAYAESPLGDLVTDAYRTLSAALQPTDPPVAAFEGNGQLRSNIAKGKTGAVWLADLYRVTPLGIGPDSKPGSPLVTFYLTPKDIASGLELGGAPEFVDDQFFLQLSGIKLEYDMTKPAFGRVSSLKLVGANNVETVLDPKDTTHCYKVVATNYVAGLLGVVSSFTKGLLSVIAKSDAACTMPFDPTNNFVDADPATAGTQELKQWQVLLKYISMFPDTTGDKVPDMPAAYMATQGRITIKK